MHRSIHILHTKSSNPPLYFSVSSRVLLVAINKFLSKFLSESHGVNGAPACNTVIPRKYISIHTIYSYFLAVFMDLTPSVRLKHFLLVRNIQDPCDTILLIPFIAVTCELHYTSLHHIPSILYQYHPAPCFNHLLRFKQLFVDFL